MPFFKVLIFIFFKKSSSGSMFQEWWWLKWRNIIGKDLTENTKRYFSIVRPTKIFTYKIVELVVEWSEEFPQFVDNICGYIWMWSTFALCQTFFFSRLSNTMKAFRRVEVKVVSANLRKFHENKLSLIYIYIFGRIKDFFRLPDDQHLETSRPWEPRAKVS